MIRYIVPFVIFFSGFILFPVEAVPGKSYNDILVLVQKLKVEADSQIIANYGQSSFVSFKEKFKQTYPLSKYPVPNVSNSCDLFNEPSEIAKFLFESDVINQAGAYYITGIEAVFAGRPEAAKWCFANCALLSPKCPDGFLQLGFILNIQKDYQNAVILLKYAAQLDPKEGSVYINIGYSYQNLEKYDEAIQAYLTAIGLDPQYTKYHEILLLAQLEKQEALKKKKGKDTTATKSKNLDEALSMLEEKKKEKLNEQWDQEISGVEHELQKSAGGRVKNRLDPEQAFRKDYYNFGNFDMGSFGLPFNDFCGMATFLDGLAAQYQNAPPPSSALPLTKAAVKMAGQNMYILFKGYAHEAALACGDKDLADQIESSAIDGFMDIAKEYAKSKKKSEPKKEVFQKLSLKVLSFSRGSKGTNKLGISSGIVSAELKYNSITYNFGIKVALGKKFKQSLGFAEVNVGGEAYFEVDLDNGPAVGVDLKQEAKVLGQGLGTKFKVYSQNLSDKLR